MIKRMWYMVVKGLFNLYVDRLSKDIPQPIVDLFLKYDIDLYEVRFHKAVLSIGQVESVLDTNKRFNTIERIAIKNILFQTHVMEEGYVYADDANITGVKYQAEKAKPNIWKHAPRIWPHNPKVWKKDEIKNEVHGEEATGPFVMYEGEEENIKTSQNSTDTKISRYDS